MTHRPLVALSLLALVCQAAAFGADDSATGARCTLSEVEVVDQRRIEGCTAQYCTTGTIRGSHGLRGTIDADFDSFAAGPATTPEPARTISFSSVSTITTARGTLQARETGISAVGALEPARRFFAGYGEFIGGTGAYAGATGWLMFAGRNTDGVNVTDTMLVKLCLPRR